MLSVEKKKIWEDFTEKIYQKNNSNSKKLCDQYKKIEKVFEISP